MIETAAVAATYGIDPLDVLALDPDDHDVLVAALGAAERLRVRREENLIKVLARSIGAETGNRVARSINRALRAMAG